MGLSYARKYRRRRPLSLRAQLVDGPVSQHTGAITKRVAVCLAWRAKLSALSVSHLSFRLFSFSQFCVSGEGVHEKCLSLVWKPSVYWHPFDTMAAVICHAWKLKTFTPHVTSNRIKTKASRC